MGIRRCATGSCSSCSVSLGFSVGSGIFHHIEYPFNNLFNIEMPIVFKTHLVGIRAAIGTVPFGFFFLDTKYNFARDFFYVRH